MENRIEYSTVQGNSVVLLQETYDYTIFLNGMQVMTTGDETEAEIVAESLDVALSILGIQGKLK